MSQAEELLNSLTEIVVEHSHEVPDSDAHFVIDPYTREITAARYSKTVLMQGDHNSERFTFELPRYIDGHDMSLCNRVIVHFDNVGETIENIYSDVAYMYDLQINPSDPETVISSWLIRREATQIVGILSFSLQYQCVEEDEITYEWNTDSYDEIEIRKSKQNGEAAIVKYTNVLEQWRSQIFDASNSIMASITSEGESRVAAIVAEGESQLSTITTEGATQVGAITAEGESQLSTITSEGNSKLTAITAEGESQLSTITTEGANQVTAVQTESATQQAAIELKGSETLATIPEDYTEVYNMASEAVRTKADGIVCEAEGEVIVLNDSSDDYIRGLNLYGKSTQFTTTGKNLLKNTANTTTVNGVVYTVNDDGSVYVSGTNTGGNTYLPLSGGFEAGAYEIPDWLKTGDTFTISDALLYLYDGSGMVKTVGLNETFTVPDGYVYYGVFILVTAGETVNKLYRPMIRVSSEPSGYEPYTGGAPSPNPEYPQEIASIENPKVDVYGKNLLNIHTTPAATLAAAVEVDGESVTVSSTDDVILTRAVYRLNYPKNTPLTISFDATILDLPSVNLGTTVRLRKGNQSTGIVMLDLTQIGVKKHYEITAEPLTEDGYELWLYLRTFNEASGYVSVKFENIQVEVGEVATEYEPYKEVQSLSCVHTLPGIPVTSGGNYTDSNGQQWICDEIDLEREMYVQRVAVETYDGRADESWWTYASTGYEGYARTAKNMKIGSRQNGYCDRFQVHSGGVFKPGVWFGAENDVLYVHNIRDMFATLELWKEWLSANPVTVVFPLATPIETPLTAEEIESYKALKTNYPNTTILNDAGAWMKTKYNADTKLYINNAALNGAVSAVEEVLNDTY